MSKFLKAMSKIGLVELNEKEQKAVASSGPDDELSMADIDAILASEAKAAPPAAPPPRAAQPAPSAPTRRAAAGAPGAPIVENQPFEEIYAEARVPGVGYPAEKLLKVLDGLKAMDPPMRKAAILAMDSADDAWTVADAVLDAERKIQALSHRKQGLMGTVESMAQDAAAEKQRRDEYLAQATKTLRDKITELEQTLQDEAAQIAAQKAEIDGKLTAARLALSHEQSRLDHEAERLAEVPRVFAIARPQ